jgi:hypothetical protein
MWLQLIVADGFVRHDEGGLGLTKRNSNSRKKPREENLVIVLEYCAKLDRSGRGVYAVVHKV